MAEEEKEKQGEVAPKKEETATKKEEVPAEKPKEVPAEKPKEAAPAAPAAGHVKPSNCTQCNKPLKRGNWYYRNGKFYCNKRCWKKSTEKVA